VRFATVNYQGEATFVLAPSGSKEFVLWQDYAKQFHNDKMVSQTTCLLDFIQRSSVLTEHVKNNSDALKKCPKHTFGEKDFLLPFTPVLFRDFYCFEEHVMAARKGRGLEMIPEWYQAPIFYYSNPISFQGPFEVVPYPKDSEEVDLELEIAAIVGKEIRNATVEQARAAIFGYCLLNDWTARDFQRFEMKVNMGPTKGKDFSTTFGSFVITPDEIESKRVNKGYDIEIEALINGERLTRNNWKKIQFSFEEMLVRASKNCKVLPGEVIASGTMGGGCLMEHNLASGQKRWLKKNDTVTLNWLPDGPSISNRIGESIE
jgi:2-keto-4-pentenoate hydratase/2-oxohepta-3-ene-1,7-dioic acid hydratase in catechol pathway